MEQRKTEVEDGEPGSETQNLYGGGKMGDKLFTIVVERELLET